MKKSNYETDDLLFYDLKAEKLLNYNISKLNTQTSKTELIAIIEDLLKQNEELKYAEETARVSSEKYVEQYDLLPFANFTLSREAKILELNQYAIQMLGKERNTLLNCDLYLFISEESIPIFNLFLNKLFKTNIKETCEIMFSLNKDKPIYFTLTGMAIKDKDYCLISVIDNTGYKHVEDEIHKSREQFVLAMEAANDGFFDWDITTGLVYYSPACYHILGYEDNEIEDFKIKFESLVHAEDIDKVNNIINEHIVNNNAQRFSVEYRMKAKDGSWKWILSRAKITNRDKNGKALRIVGTHIDITKRKEIEEIQKQNEIAIISQYELLSSFLKYSPIYAYIKEVKSTESKVLFASENFIDMIGVPGSEMIGKTMNELFPADFASKITADDWAVASGDNAKRYDEFLNGRNYLTIKQPIMHNGKTMLAGYTIDITERKKAEEIKIKNDETISRQNELLKILLDNLQIGVFMVEAPSGKPLIANDKALEILGRGILPDANRENLSEVFNAFRIDSRDSYPVEEMPIYRAIHGETSYIDDLMVVKPDGTEVYLEIYGSPVKDLNGNIWASLVSFEDITQRKITECKLNESNKRFNELIELAVDGILIGSNEGIIIDANSCICEMIGKSKDEIIGKHISQSFFTEESIKQYPIQFDLLNKGELVIKERKIQRPDGVEITIEMRTKKMSNGEYQSFFRDITKRKKNEEALNQLNQVLEQKVNERTLQLTKSYFNIERISKNYETFFNTIDELLLVLDSNGNFLYFNKSAVNQLGYEVSEIKGKSIHLIYAKEYHKEISKKYLEIYSTKVEFNHIPVTTKMGFQFLVDTKTFRGEWDNKPAVFGILNNITKVSFSEKKFSALFNLNPIACGLNELDTSQFIEVNESFCNLFGFSKNEIIGNTIVELGIMKVDLRESILQKADKNGRLVNFKTNLKAKNGDSKHVLLSAEIISLPDKKYRFTVCQDITEQTHAEAIQNQQLNFSNAYNKITEIIISNNTSQDILIKTNSIIRSVLKIDISLICNVSFEKNKIIILTEFFKKEYQDLIPLFQENFNLETFKKTLTEIKNNQHYVESHFDKMDGSYDILHNNSGIKSLLWYPFAFNKEGYYLLVLNQIAKQRSFSHTEITFIKSIVKLVNIALLKIKLLDRIKLNEISLFEKEFNLRESQQIAQIGCWEYDNTNHQMRWSDETFRLLGYKPQHFTPTIELFYNSIHKDDIAFVIKAINKSWNSNKPLFINIRIVINGKIKMFTLNAEVIYDGISKSYKWVGVIQDITEKKKTEELLKNTIIHLRQLRLYNEKVREDERLNISRELHDDLGQVLTAVNIEVGLINKNTSDTELLRKINTISTLVDETIGKVQKLTMQLRPVMIDDLGLGSAMEWYVAEFEERNKINILLQMDSEIEVSTDIAIHLFRVTQEALTNIARHAKASQLIIWLNVYDDYVFLRIADNGIGITDKGIKSKKSFGLISMKERMMSLGGCFDVFSKEGKGTVINAFLPLH